VNTYKTYTSSQIPSQPGSFFEGESVYKMCIKLFNIPINASSETLSYTEKILMKTCHELDAGYEIDTDMLMSILDEENMAKFARLYYAVYMGEH